MLNDEQVERYSRQIILPQVGGRGQHALLSASVAVVGSADLCTAAALYLAAAGVGRLTLSAPTPVATITGMNPDCRVAPLPSPLTRDATAELARTCDVMIAGGSPEVCHLLNAACVAHRTPFVWGDAVGALGLISVFRCDHDRSPCYDCVQTQLAHLLASGATANPLAEATAAFVGTQQATEAIKLLLGLEGSLPARAMTCDIGSGRIDAVPMARNPRCMTCGTVRA